MRIGVSVGTEAIGRPAPPSAFAEQARSVEDQGFASAWSVHFSRGIDSLSALLVAGAATSTIALGAGVVPIYPRHPVALAQQAATVQSLLGGRLTLGVGVSHRPVTEAMFGLPFTRPAAYLREYLAVLVPMLQTGKARFDGEFFQVDAEFTVPGTSPVPVLVGGLSAGMVRVGGELADGVITWLAGLRTLEQLIIPGVCEAAASAGRPAPRVVAALPVMVTDDVGAARTVAHETFARYGGLVNYQKQFEREQVSGPAELAIVGNERSVTAQLAAYADLGVTEFSAVTMPVAGSGKERTLDLLATLEGGGSSS